MQRDVQVPRRSVELLRARRSEVEWQRRTDVQLWAGLVATLCT